MLKFRKSLIVTTAGLALAALTAGALLWTPNSAAYAAGPDVAAVAADVSARRGGPGGPGGRGELKGGIGAEYLAQALGVTVEELQAAQTAAHQAALAQAVKDGQITQAQADRLTARGEAGGRGGRGGFGHGGLVSASYELDMDAYLAEALDISADELIAARAEAVDLAVQAGITAGTLTEEQGELIKARQAVRGYVGRDTLQAAALGISVDELHAAQDAGKRLPDLLTELGLTAEEARANMLTAYTAAVDQAVADGAITAEQATLLKANIQAGGKLGLPGFDHGMGGRGGRGGGAAPAAPSTPSVP